MTRLNGNKLAQALGYTRQHISKLEKQGVIGRGDDGLFDLEEAKSRTGERSGENIDKSAVGPVDFALYRARKMAADAIQPNWKPIK